MVRPSRPGLAPARDRYYSLDTPKKFGKTDRVLLDGYCARIPSSPRLGWFTRFYLFVRLVRYAVTDRCRYCGGRGRYLDGACVRCV